MLSWADFSFLSVRFALAIAAFTAFCSALVSFLADNHINLLIKSILPVNDGIKIIGSVRSLLGTKKQYVDHILKNHFQMLTVLFIHRKKKGRDHGENHHQGGGGVTQRLPEPEIDRDANGETWISRGQNFVIAYSKGMQDGVFARSAQVDEYAVIIPDAETQVEITTAAGTEVVPGYSVVFVPPATAASAC